MSRSIFYIAIALCLGISDILAQNPPQDNAIDASTIEIGSIYIAGNNRTREEIILRELSIKKGDFFKQSDY